MHKRTINPPFHSSPLLSSFAFLHFYSRYSRGNQPLFRLDVFGILSFMRIKEEREREREVLTRHELDSRGRIWEGEWEGMDKRNLDLGWIIERNWTPFDRFLRNQSDKLDGHSSLARVGAFRKILKNRRVLRDKWKSLFWRCWEIETRARVFFLLSILLCRKPFQVSYLRPVYG